jgi:aminoglycoside phosphotransferase (APT) family kinase protein
VAFKNKIDPGTAQRNLAAWFRTKYEPDANVEVTDVEIPTANGLSCETVLLTASWHDGAVRRQERMVARVAPTGESVSAHIFPEYDLELEAKVMRALGQHTAVRVPQVLFTDSDPEVLGGPFLLMKYIAGRVPPDDPPYTAPGWVLDLPKERQGLLLDGLVTSLVDIHAADWRALGLQNLDHPERGAPGEEQFIGWVEHLYETGARGRSHPTLEAGIAWARANVVADDRPLVLNWGDARLGNILYGEDLSVAGVLDWEAVNLSCREQDVGYVLFNLDFFSEGFGLSNPPGFPSEAEVIARYEELSGHTLRNIDHFKALASLWSGVMLMRVAYVMIENGLLPEDSPMPQSNPASGVMARLMDLPAPDAAAVNWTGRR